MAAQAEYAKRIMVALDYANAEEAKRTLEALRGIPCWMKVGMQLFYAEGSDFIRYLKEQGYRVFLDLKLHDIPNTVKGAAGSITKLGVDMFNVHAAGGVKMMKAALEGVEEALTMSSGLTRPTVIGVTQLTSTNQTVLNEEIGIPGPVEDAVLNYARLSQTAGLDGVVASPAEVVKIKQACGAAFQTVTPGIRPAGADLGDQFRVMTPNEAFAQGTDFVVIGRPITAAVNPRKSLETIVESILG